MVHKAARWTLLEEVGEGEEEVRLVREGGGVSERGGGEGFFQEEGGAMEGMELKEDTPIGGLVVLEGDEKLGSLVEVEEHMEVVVSEGDLKEEEPGVVVGLTRGVAPDGVKGGEGAREVEVGRGGRRESGGASSLRHMEDTPATTEEVAMSDRNKTSGAILFHLVTMTTASAVVVSMTTMEVGVVAVVGIGVVVVVVGPRNGMETLWNRSMNLRLGSGVVEEGGGGEGVRERVVEGEDTPMIASQTSHMGLVGTMEEGGVRGRVGEEEVGGAGIGLLMAVDLLLSTHHHNHLLM